MSLEAIGRVADSAIARFKRHAPAIVAVGALAAAVSAWRTHERSRPPADPIAAVGRTYLSALGDVYAGAWNEGAAALEAGKPVPDALKVVAAAWQTGRVALFDRTAAPTFTAIVPENAAEADVTVGRRAALAAAWRSFAAGLRSPVYGR